MKELSERTDGRKYTQGVIDNYLKEVDSQDLQAEQSDRDIQGKGSRTRWCCCKILCCHFENGRGNQPNED